MAAITSKHGYEIYTIVADDGCTQASFIPEKGGVGCSLIMPHETEMRETLYLHDYFWERNRLGLAGGWPCLFPICGRLEWMGVAGNYSYADKVYNMPIHGFAADAKWLVTDNSQSDSLTLELSATEDTLAMYPFEFKVQLTYQVKSGVLSCKQRYSNLGVEVMPYYAGFHPYFLTPEVGKGKEQVAVNFKPQRTLRYNERLTDIIGEQCKLELPAAITMPYINERVSEVAEGEKAELSYPDGFRLVLGGETAKCENMFKYMHLYTIPTEPFCCIEPWMGVPNALNSVSGVRWLQSGQSEEGELVLSCDSGRRGLI